MELLCSKGGKPGIMKCGRPGIVINALPQRFHRLNGADAPPQRPLLVQCNKKPLFVIQECSINAFSGVPEDIPNFSPMLFLAICNKIRPWCSKIQSPIHCLPISNGFPQGNTPELRIKVKV